MRNIKLITALIGILLVSGSCKKTKLEDDKSILAGKWHWLYSVQMKYLSSAQSPYIDTIWPSEADHSYKLELLKNGKMKLTTDGDCKKYRIVIQNYAYDGSTDSYSGELYFEDYNNPFTLYDRSTDELVINNIFPFNRVREELYDYVFVNYFSRE